MIVELQCIVVDTTPLRKDGFGEQRPFSYLSFLRKLDCIVEDI